MKKRYFLTSSLLSLAVTTTPCAAVNISGVDTYTVSQTPVFESAADVSLTLRIDALSECNGITMTLVQRANALAATLDERQLTECTPNARSEISFNFTTPQVERLTRFAWEFQRCDGTTDCTAVGEVEFVVLPPDHLQPLIDWSTEHTIYVVDADGWLVAFLERIGVLITEDPRAIPPNEEVVMLVTVAESAAAPNASKDRSRPAKRIIEFHDYPSEQAIVWIDSSTSARVIEVRFPLIHEIGKDAANKKIIYELFQRLF